MSGDETPGCKVDTTLTRVSTMIAESNTTALTQVPRRTWPLCGAQLQGKTPGKLGNLKGWSVRADPNEVIRQSTNKEVRKIRTILDFLHIAHVRRSWSTLMKTMENTSTHVFTRNHDKQN